MVAQLIWIAAVYASAVAIIHMLHSREQTRQTPRARKWIHYILITRNHETVVEGYIRALNVCALLTGKRLRMTLMDDSSSDGTLEIVSRMARSGSPIDLVQTMPILQADEAMMQQGIVVDLRLSEQQIKLPFMRTTGSRGYGSKRGGR